MIQKLLMLDGSPKVKPGNSNMLGVHLMEGLDSKLFETKQLRIVDFLRGKDQSEELVREVNDCDYMLLTFPLYVDCPPALVIKAMKIIDESRKAEKPEKDQKMMAISNCGFPEPHQNESALDTCRIFAEKTGFKWMGGIGVAGLTGVVSNDGLKKDVAQAPLKSFGMKTKNFSKGLDTAAKAISQGEPLTSDGSHILLKQALPPRMYCWVGKRMWRGYAKRNGALEKFNDRPLQQEA